jgi:hypothetical protein
VTKNIPALLLALGLLFGAAVGIAAHGGAGSSSPFVGGVPPPTTVSAASGTGALLPCICYCGYECDGTTCDVDAPDSCSDEALVTCGLSCCGNAPLPDPGCQAEPIFADEGPTPGAGQVGG